MNVWLDKGSLNDGGGWSKKGFLSLNEGWLRERLMVVGR